MVGDTLCWLPRKPIYRYRGQIAKQKHHSVQVRLHSDALPMRRIDHRQAPAREEPEQQGDHRGAAHAGGFSLHAGLDIQPHQREKLERLCRYVSRPPIAVERLALTSSGCGE